MNNFFSDAVNELDIDRSVHVEYVTNINNPIDKAIAMFKNHPSILSINELGYSQNNFSFQPIYESNIHINTDSTKAHQQDSIT